MSAFLIVHSTISKPEVFQQYVEAAAHSLELYKGEYLLGGGVNEVLEGQHNKSRTVIFQFPSAEQAKAWYNSAEYRKVKHLRDNAGEFDFILVDSF